MIHEPTGNYDTGSLRPGPLAVKKASILFLTECYSPPARAAHRRCPGYGIDRIKALKEGGADEP